MALKLAKRKSQQDKKASTKQTAKVSSQQDDVLAFLEKQKKDAKAKEDAGLCMFC